MTQSLTLVLAGNVEAPGWVSRLDALPDTTLHHITEREGYVSQVVDLYAAMILVDAGADDLEFWVATPKSSPASRRIPVVLVADDPAAHNDLLRSGVDLAITPDELTERLIRDYARVYDPALIEQLECECGEALPELAEQGVAQFNEGEFYKQHDSFEELWMATDGPVRDLYRAILQVGVAYYQILRGNHRGAKKMLLRSVQWLTVLPDACQGVDVKALREDSYRVRAALDAIHEDEIDTFDRDLLQPVKRVQ